MRARRKEEHRHTSVRLEDIAFCLQSTSAARFRALNGPSNLEFHFRDGSGECSLQTAP